jgi:predicted amidohydrolase
MKLAAIQMNSGDDMAENSAMLRTLIAQASQAGAQFIATPENSFYMRREGSVAIADYAMRDHPGIACTQEAAVRHGVWILIGSVRVREVGMSKAFNRSVLVAPTGVIAATYDKIHLFDVDLPGGQSYRESSQAQAGAHAVVAPIDASLTLGMSICYDLRFPALYQMLSAKGAGLLAVPSAFTRPTGAAHWHSLLQARAIENAAYVIAPAQCGTHPGGRETYGHSMILDPWGEVLAVAQGDYPQLIYATYDPARLAQVRAHIPVLAHRQPIL